MQKTIRSHSVWDACGNIIGIVELDPSVYRAEYSCAHDLKLRIYLSQWGKRYGCDSIMVLSESKRVNVHAEVFEPNAGTSALPGGISTMCGNGIRAVGAFYQSRNPTGGKHIQVSTLSGCRTVVSKGNDNFCCEMGSFYDDSTVMGKYVNKEAKSAAFPQLLLTIEKILGVPVRHNSMGLSGNVNADGFIDGEPHLVLVFDSRLQKTERKILRLVTEIGTLLTKNLKVFPYEINTNVCFLKKPDSQQFELINYTFERNLGNDPMRSITKSCGTGATALAGVMFKKFQLSEDTRVMVHTMGGKLEVEKREECLLLTGKAVRIW